MSTRSYIERRQGQSDQRSSTGERRQFADGRDHLAPEVRELAEAIDRYKLEHHRRFIDHEELLGVMRRLGYRKASEIDAAERALEALASEVGLDQSAEPTDAVLTSR